MKNYKVKLWVNLDGDDVYSSLLVTAQDEQRALHLAINKQYGKSKYYFALVDHEVEQC